MVRRWSRRVAFAVLVAAVLYFAAYLWIDAVADSRLEAELTRIRERGEPLKLEEMAPAPIPDERNAAIPLARAAPLLSDWEGEEFEAHDRLIEAPFDVQEQTVAIVAAWVERNGPALLELQEAIRRSDCRFELDYSDVLAMDMPPVTQILDGGRLLVARSLLRAREGRIEDAIEDCLGALRIAELAGSDPILILFLVRVAIERCALDSLEKILARNELPEGIRGRLLESLAAIDVRRGFRRTLLGERCFGLAAFETVLGDPGALDQVGFESLWCAAPNPVLRLDEAYYLRFMARCIEMADRPYFEARASWKSLQKDITDTPWYYPLSRLVGVMFPRMAERSESHRALLEMARIALGSEVDSLDPFTGKPYEVIDGKLLRSPGPDPDDESDDITWRLGSGRDRG